MKWLPPSLFFFVRSDHDNAFTTSQEDDQRWVMSGHDIIFDKIMMMVGHDSLESLHRCRQVCTAWNAMIMQNIWESPSKRNILLIEENWGPHTLPSKDAINHAKWLGKN